MQTTDDGVSTLLILSTCCVPCDKSLASMVNTSVRVANVYPTEITVGVLLLGVVNVIVGA